MTVLAVIAALGAFGLLGELVARAIAHVSPEPLRWHDLFTQRREDQMRSLARSGGVDVVATGASDVQFSIDPLVLGDALGRSCYNASIYRGLPTVTEHWLDDRVLDLLQPQFVILGVSPVTLNDDTPLKSRLDEYLAAPVFHAGRLRRLHWHLGRYSFAVRYAGLLRRPRRLMRLLATVARRSDVWRWRVPIAIPGELDEFGRCTTLLDRSFGHGPRMLELIHQQAGPGYRDGGEQMGAILRTIRLVQERGATPIVVITPMSGELIDGVFSLGRAGWNESADRLRRFAAAAGARVIDVAANLGGQDYFADMLHTNRAGQAEFSSRLAKALVDELHPVGRQPMAAARATRRESLNAS